MWDTIRKDNRIVTKSSWLGLRTTAFYAPTHLSLIHISEPTRPY